jgi:hypothetical protein
MASDPAQTTDDEPLRNVLTMDDAQAIMRRNNELLVENEKLREIKTRAMDWMRFADTEIAVRRADPYLSDTNRMALAIPVGKALDRLRDALKELDHAN